MKKIIKLILLLLFFVFINKVYAEQVRFHFYAEGATSYSSNIVLDGKLITLKKDGSYYALYDINSTINNINSINGEVFSLSKNNVKLTEWYANDLNGKKHYFKQGKQYIVKNVVKELGLKLNDLIVIDLYPNWNDSSNTTQTTDKKTTGSKYKTIIKYNVNDGKLDSKHAKEITIGLLGIIKKNNAELLSKVANNGEVDLYNVNNVEHINLIKKGYYLDTSSAWNTKKDGTGKSFSQSKKYNTSDFCDSSKKDCTVTLYANWKKAHVVNIEYNMNGGQLAKEHGKKITVSGRVIKCSGNNICSKIYYKDKLPSYGLVDYNNKNGVNLVRTGYYINTSQAWNTKADGTGKTYNQFTVYKSADFCDASKKDCKVTLYANWKKGKATVYKVNIKYNMNGGQLANKHSKSISSDSNGYILNNGSDVVSKINFGGTLPSYGLSNYNYVDGINIERKGYYIDSTKVWNTKKDGTGKSYDQTTIYKASDFCDASKKDCTVTLYANWKKETHYTIIEYNVNGGKQAAKHGDNYSFSLSGMLKNNNKEIKTKIRYNESFDLVNINNASAFNLEKKGYHYDVGAEWNTKKDGTGKTFSQTKKYKTSDFCDSSKKDCTVTLYVNWKKNPESKIYYVNIKLNMNGGRLSSNHSNTITSGNNGIIKCSGNEVCQKVKYDGVLDSNGLWNYNNANGINIERKGYYINYKYVWNTKKDGTGKSFDQTTAYKASDFCNAKSKDCTITLYANWVKINPKVSTYLYKGTKGCHHIWYAVIPSTIKMHYAYGKDTVLGQEKPSENAKRHGAKVAVDTEFLGFPIVNNKKLTDGASVKNKDFIVEYDLNPDGTVYYEDNKRYDVFRVYATDAGAGGLNFKDTNLSYYYGGNGVPYDFGSSQGVNNIYMALYEQTVMNGELATTHFPYLQDEKHPRAWLAYDYQGNQYVAVSSGRRVESTVNGVTCLNEDGLDYREEYNIIKKLLLPGMKIKTLFNLDGGGSVSFVNNGIKMNPNIDVIWSPNPDGSYYRSGTAERETYGIFYWKW